jgi:hypothetical protein
MFNDPNTGVAGCDSNVWSANIWSAVGFFPACTTNAGGQATPPAFTSAPSATFAVGGLGDSFTLTAAGVPIPAIALSGGTLPGGVKYHPSTGVLSGAPAKASLGSYPLTFTAHNPLGPDATQSFTLNVVVAPTTTTVASSPANVFFGQPATFTATVAPAAANFYAPSGTVSFFAEGNTVTPVATVALANGQASFTTAGLGAGSQTVTARYNGDALFSPSSGATTATIAVTRTITGTWNKNLVVAPGTFVLVSGAQVNGNITVQSGGNLDIENAAVNGTITATQPGALRMCATSTTSSMSVSTATGLVLIGDPGDDACGGDTIGGPLSVVNSTGGVEILATGVNGPLTATNDSGTGAFPEDTAPEIGNG